MREFLNVLETAMNYTIAYGTVALLIIMAIEMQVTSYKKAKAKERQDRLNKRREEFEAKMKFKKRKFEEYKSYIESLNFDEQVDIKEVDEDSLTLEEGVTKLVKETHHTYRPYEVNTFDIRDTLREFTVQDVLNTFYI